MMFVPVRRAPPPVVAPSLDVSRLKRHNGRRARDAYQHAVIEGIVKPKPARRLLDIARDMLKP